MILASRRHRRWWTAIALLGFVPGAWGAATPTLQNVSYGTNSQQVLDFYKANSTKPTPLLFYIHGGAWTTGDKANPDFLDQALASGISVVSINYRLITGTAADGAVPVKMCLDDTARALQFVRSKAADWNIDKQRVAAVGGSAGGYNALYLAFHPDLANPQSSDPVSRESTRVTCALGFVPQTTLDPTQMTAWLPSINYGQQAFGLPSYQAFVQQRDALLPTIKDVSPYYLASPDDPAVYMFYDTVPAMGTNNSADLVHSSNWGAGLAAQLDTVGVKYELNYPGAKVAHPDLFSFLTDQLNAPVTPEPASLGLLATAGLLLRRRRRA